MDFAKKTLLPILLATIWISVSEFIRNELLLKSYWTGHYEKMGLVFPSEPINGAMWGVGCLVPATGHRHFHAFEEIQYSILVYAIPLSLLECFVAAWIIQKTG